MLGPSKEQTQVCSDAGVSRVSSAKKAAFVTLASPRAIQSMHWLRKEDGAWLESALEPRAPTEGDNDGPFLCKLDKKCTHEIVPEPLGAVRGRAEVPAG